MPNFWRSIRPVLLVTIVSLLVLPLASLPSYAQGDQPKPVTIQGTPELEKLVTAVRDAYVAAHADAKVEIDPRGGLRSGFEALCNGSVDVVMSTEPISDAEIQACTANNQNFIETVLAYEAVALLPTPEAGLTCVDQTLVEGAWQLGAAAQVTWTDLGSTKLQTPVSFYGPDDLNPAYLLFKSLVPAGALRDGIVTSPDVSAVFSKVQEAGSNAFGFMSLADLESLNQSNALTPLGLSTQGGDCITPNASTLAARTYPLSRTDYLYVNAGSAQRTEVQTFIQFALGNDAGVKKVGADQKYSVADSSTYEYGVNSVVSGKAGRTFSRPTSPVTVSTAETGTVTITGTSALKGVSDPILNEFKTRFPSATITYNAASNNQGWQAFCKGEADVIQSTRPPTADEKALCDQNGINPYTLDLGYQALVLAVPTSADAITCVTGDEVAKLLRAGTDTAAAPKKWNEVNPAWPDKDLLLVIPPLNTGETDYLINTLVADFSFAVRGDATTSADPLYRVQGVANTDNGFTYLWWTDLQRSTAQVKQLPVGPNCVAPSPATFADGTYPLSYPISYSFSQKAFSNPLVRALLWHFFDQTTLATLGKNPFSGLDVKVMGDTKRDEVYNLLAEYEAAHPAAQPTPAGTGTPGATEGTPAPTAETTAAPTVEPTAAPTTEPTAQPTVEPTAAPTAEPTAAPTAAPTAVPTVEPTAVPTTEPTAQPTVEPTAAPSATPTVAPTATTAK